MSPRPPWHPESLAARLPFLRRRARLVADTRAFFAARGYAEAETPCLVPVPGMEVHLRAFRSEYRPHLGAGTERTLWLRTSPELALKRLLVAGAGPVFELARVWRNGEAAGPLHAPEFTMLEWYRPGLLCIGDSAHAMSPIGGVGINLAIQDAVAAANILVEPLRAGTPELHDLARVRKRREFPTRMTQRLQVLVQDRVLGPTLESRAPLKPPLVFKLLRWFPALRRLPARVIGLGVRPEHVRTPDVRAGETSL